MDTAAFVDFLIGRCRAQLAGIRFGAVLFIVNLTFCLVWIYQHRPRPEIEWFGWRMDLIWLVGVAFYIFLFWWNGRKKRELAWLLGLREQAWRKGRSLWSRLGQGDASDANLKAS